MPFRILIRSDSDSAAIANTLNSNLPPDRSAHESNHQTQLDIRHRQLIQYVAASGNNGAPRSNFVTTTRHLIGLFLHVRIEVDELFTTAPSVHAARLLVSVGVSFLWFACVRRHFGYGHSGIDG
jgi:hypothetical protein